MSDWTKTGSGDIEITTGDSTYLIDEEQEECKVWVSVSRDKNWNYVHFNYDGGTGYSLRMPKYVKDANT